MPSETRDYGPAFRVPGSVTGFVTCPECGGAIMLDAEVNAMEVHDRWHDAMNARAQDTSTALRGEET